VTSPFCETRQALAKCCQEWIRLIFANCAGRKFGHSELNYAILNHFIASLPRSPPPARDERSRLRPLYQEFQVRRTHKGQPNRSITFTPRKSPRVWSPLINSCCLFQTSDGNSVSGVRTYANVEFRPRFDQKIREDEKYSCRLEFVDKNKRTRSSLSSSSELTFDMRCGRRLPTFVYPSRPRGTQASNWVRWV
jgi:hypothetical protein